MAGARATRPDGAANAGEQQQQQPQFGWSGIIRMIVMAGVWWWISQNKAKPTTPGERPHCCVTRAPMVAPGPRGAEGSSISFRRETGRSKERRRASQAEGAFCSSHITNECAPLHGCTRVVGTLQKHAHTQQFDHLHRCNAGQSPPCVRSAPPFQRGCVLVVCA
jgi:hypothetical protein